MISKLGRANAEESAISGIERSHKKLEGAAQEITRASLGANRAASVAISAEGRSLALSAEDGSTGDLAGALVESLSAKHEQAANIKVLETSDEMKRELLRATR